MIDQDTPRTASDYQDGSPSARQQAIEAYEGARDRAVDTLGDAPLIALAGGLAAGALIAALLPRTDTETRFARPTARRVKGAARAAAEEAWRGKAQGSVDDAELKYVIVHLHRLLEPDIEGSIPGIERPRQPAA